MKGTWGKAKAMGLAIAGLVGVCASAQAGQHPLFASVGGRTSIPYGWIDFCNRYAPECDGKREAAVDIDLTPSRLKQIDRVNRDVNRTITPITDMDHWGVVDRWDYPTDGKGDCEDYALLKRKILINEGVPRQALLMTVVKDLEGAGHAVLTVRTSKGDYVLDNLSDKVKLWSDTGYMFVKRQSQEDPNVWLQIGPPLGEPQYTAADR